MGGEFRHETVLPFPRPNERMLNACFCGFTSVLLLQGSTFKWKHACKTCSIVSTSPPQWSTVNGDGSLFCAMLQIQTNHIFGYWINCCLNAFGTLTAYQRIRSLHFNRIILYLFISNIFHQKNSIIHLLFMCRKLLIYSMWLFILNKFNAADAAVEEKNMIYWIDSGRFETFVKQSKPKSQCLHFISSDSFKSNIRWIKNEQQKRIESSCYDKLLWLVSGA